MIVQMELREEVSLLFTAARTRGIGPEELARRIVRAVLQDNIVDAVLDDDVSTPEPTMTPVADERASRTATGRARRPHMTARARETVILEKLSRGRPMWIGDFEPAQNARGNWVVAMKMLITDGKVEPLPKRDGKRQYYRLRAKSLTVSGNTDFVATLEVTA